MAIDEEKFLAQLLQTFHKEAQEHMQALSNGLISLESERNKEKKTAIIEEVFREAHSLKGAARAVNLREIEKLCQSIESIFSDWKNQISQPDEALFDVMYQSLDLISEFLGTDDAALREENKLKMLKMVEAFQGKPKNTTETKTAPKAAQSSLPSVVTGQTIRVSTEKLDLILQEVEELLMVKLSLEQRTNQVQQLQGHFYHFEKEISKFFNARHSIKKCGSSSKEMSDLIDFLEHSPEFLREFSENLHILFSGTSQDSRLTANMVDSLLDNTKKLLMQPFSTLFEAFPRMVRDISHALKKEISLEIHGAEIEIDRRILEEMKDPFMHLLRNCIDHGIESTEERQALSKNSVGKLTIAITQKSGNLVEILVTDDGKGIDSEKVLKAAIKQGIIKQGQAESMPPEDVLRLIFHSGVSTAEIITDLSGRGLGMGIIAEKVEKLGGYISVTTEPGKGSSFLITLPLTLATFRGIHVRAQNHDFIIPTQNVRRTFRIRSSDISTVENREVIQQGGQTFSFIRLGHLLKLAPSNKTNNQYEHVLLVRCSETTIALAVDEILSEQEVFIKSLGKQLAKIRNISAATILEGGKIVSILDPFDLVKNSLLATTAHTDTVTEEKLAEETKARTVLLVEDSATARVLLKNILESAGYRVLTAVDGVEGFSILKTEPVDLLLSDVEMPRMNGFELAAKVRATEQLHKIPIVLCTSLATREDKEKGIEAGANAYIKKSDFTQSQLLNVIGQLL